MRKLLLFFAILATAISASAEDYILYTSWDGEIVVPNNSEAFGANIVSNTYEDGQGKILFDGEVTEIGDKAFYYSSRLTSIEIPNSVTKIGGWAFFVCWDLKSVKMGNSVTKIGIDAFSNCTNLTSIELSKSITEIGNCAFSWCYNLTSIEIPGSVTTIGDAAFCGCALTSVEIPNSVTELGNGVFYSCSYLESFTGKFASEDHRCLIMDGVLKAFAPSGLEAYTIPNSVTEIGVSAFQSCYNLASIEIPNTVTKIGNQAFYGSRLASVTIPNSVTSIGDYAFEYCTYLASVELPNSITTIAEGMFEYCTNLAQIVIPSSVTEIGNNAFAYCEGLKSVTSLNTTPPSMGKNCFPEAIYTSCAINVPDESIEAYKAARGWTDFDYLYANDEGQKGNITVNIKGRFNTVTGHRVKRVLVYGEDAEKEPAFTPGAWDAAEMRFSNNEGKHFPYLSDDAYWGFRTLKFGITDISDDARLRVMNGWWSATYADQIPLKEETKDGIWELKLTEEIARDCARGNGGEGKDLQLMLTSGTATFHSVYYDDDVEKFFGAKGNVDKTFEREIVREKKLHISGKAQGNEFNVTLDGQTIASEREDMFDAIITIKPGSVLSITNSLYDENYGPDHNCIYYTTTDDQEFWPSTYDGDFGANIISNIYEDGMGIITFDGDVTQIPGQYNGAFEDWTGRLTSVLIPNSVKTIGDRAFAGCNMTSFRIPDSVTEVGNSAFASCTNMESVVIGNSVATLGNWVFASCRSLASVNIPASVTTIGEGVFQGCLCIESFTGQFASDDNRCLVVDGLLHSFAPAGLTSYAIPSSVTKIGTSAFEGCDALASIEIPNSVTEIEKGAFSGCTGLTALVIGNSVKQMPKGTFSDSKSLKEITSLSTTPPSITNTCFPNSIYSTCQLNVPAEAVEAYKAARGWKEFDCLFADQKGKATFKVNGKFESLAANRFNTVWVYGEDPEAEPAFTPAAWDAAAMRFSDTEGKYFPSLSDEAYWNQRTLVFNITDVSEDARLKVFNGWWSATYADNIELANEVKNDIWTLALTEEIARDCARGNGGGGKDLQLMLTTGTATFHSVYYDEDCEEYFAATGDVNQTYEVEIAREKRVHIVGTAENNAFYVTLDGKPVASAKADKFDAIVTIKPGSELYIANSESDGIISVGTDPKDWKTYNLLGLPVDEKFRGIVIQNGKKVLRR